MWNSTLGRWRRYGGGETTRSLIKASVLDGKFKANLYYVRS